MSKPYYPRTHYCLGCGLELVAREAADDRPYCSGCSKDGGSLDYPNSAKPEHVPAISLIEQQRRMLQQLGSMTVKAMERSERRGPAHIAISDKLLRGAASVAVSLGQECGMERCSDERVTGGPRCAFCVPYAGMPR